MCDLAMNLRHIVVDLKLIRLVRNHVAGYDLDGTLLVDVRC
jgi:hypothetical protein